MANPLSPIDKPICGLTELNAIPTKIPAIPPSAEAIITVVVMVLLVLTPRRLAVSKFSAVARRAFPAFVFESQYERININAIDMTNIKICTM